MIVKCNKKKIHIIKEQGTISVHVRVQYTVKLNLALGDNKV